MSILDRTATIQDLRNIAQRKLPRPIFDFIDGAAFQEITLRANCEDFDKIRFRQRSLVDVSKRNLSTTILGQKSSMPAVISPCGLGGICWGNDGEKLAARAAKAADIPFTLAMLSIATMEQIHEEIGPFWFQMCLLKDKELMRALISRAISMECPVLVLTVTWAAYGLQSRSVRNAMMFPPKITPRTLWDFSKKPAWVARHFLGKRVAFNNFEGLVKDPGDLDYIVGQIDNAATWKDLEWLRSIWPGKILIKGINCAEDARLAIEHGADGVSVSNHGGNQLDSAASTISVLPDVVRGVDGRGEVLIDGGVRSGQDILKACAHGATACLLGRGHLYGLAASGEIGVTKALELMRYELDVSTALTGLSEISEASTEILV